MTAQSGVAGVDREHSLRRTGCAHCRWDGRHRVLDGRRERRRAVRVRSLASDESLVEIVRGRLEGLGAGGGIARSADSLSACRSRESTSRWPRLEAEGFAMRGRFTPGRGRRVVRAAAAGANSSLHGEAFARRDRAGARARLPAVPVRVAARDCRSARCKGRMRWRRCSRNSKASRHRRARGRREMHARRASSSTSRNGWMSIAVPGASSGRGSPRAERPVAPIPSAVRRIAGAFDAHHPAGAARRAAVGGDGRSCRSGRI